MYINKGLITLWSPFWSQNLKMVPKFLKVSNWFSFLLKRLKFVLSVESRLTHWVQAFPSPFSSMDS